MVEASEIKLVEERDSAPGKVIEETDDAMKPD